MSNSTIEIGFTRSDYYMSKLIRSITGEPVSHCVIILDGMWVVHSNFYGVHVEHIYNFQKHSEIVYKILLPNSKLEEFYTKFDKFNGNGYDFGGMIFLGLSLVLRKHFPKYVPKQNLWQQSGMFMCTEFITELVDNKEDSLITPYQLYQKILIEHNRRS